MASLNKQLLIGRLGRDPELRNTSGGKAVLNFSVATEDYKKNTTWHNLTAFDKQAELIAKYLRKGDMAYFEGRTQKRKYEKDGQTKEVTEVLVENVTLLGSPRESIEAPATTPQEDIAF